MEDSFHKNRRERIESDLTSFSDPGGITVKGSGRRVFAEWTMRGQSREAAFRISHDSGVTVTVDGASQSYRAFLASTNMADLRHLARMIQQAGPKDIFIPTRARLTDENTTDSATEILSDLVEREAEVTQVIMVTGEAGSGKTKVLQQLVLQQAERYLRGETERLLVYVNAQGRALARLNEAFATELQDLKVGLTYHSIATLARVGLVVPVVDGFDELLGVSGYDDAFSSLENFLEQLEGYGGLIASARSVYYEEEFLSRASHRSSAGEQAWSHVPVKILPWGEEDRRSFLKRVCDDHALSTDEEEGLQKGVTLAFRGNEVLASKPLFFARIVELVRQHSEFTGGDDDLLGTLTDRFLEREQKEKLLDRNQRSLLSKRDLERLMGELSEEMWNQETRELDRASVREVAEYVLDEDEVPEATRQIVVERMPTLAFLAPSEKHAGILFEHEVFFFYFLAKAVVRQYVGGSDIHFILSRSAFPDFVAERIAFELTREGLVSSLGDLQKIFDRLAEAGRTEWRRTMQVQENAGRLVMALLREYTKRDDAAGTVEGCTISNVVFPGGELSNVTLQRCAFVNVSVRRTNFSSTRFIDCSAAGMLLLEPRIKSDSTRMELDGLRVPEEVVGVHVLHDDGESTVYSPHELAMVLGRCGVPGIEVAENATRDISVELLSLLERLVRAYRRANLLCDGDQNLQGLFGDPRWPELRALLVEFGIVTVERRPTSGTSKEFLRRRFAPEEIMSGASRRVQGEEQVNRFWDALEQAA